MHSSLVSFADGFGCTVGPGAVGRPAGGGGAADLLDVGAGGIRWGYWRLAAPAAFLAALEVEEPIVVASSDRKDENLDPGHLD